MNSATRIVVLSLTCALGGCASTANPKDPFERFNRAMFNFNDALDQHAVKPVAEKYSKFVPNFVQIGVGNFFGNLGDVWTTVNNFLQGKVADGFSDVMRVAVNSTLGLGGVLDIGTEAGLVKHKEDFGQTLGKWGVRPGPYVVLPVLGSSTLRDTVATPLDLTADLWQHKYPVRWRNTGTIVRLVDQRAALLGASNLLEDAALDRYEFVRDAYMQRRESKVHDGETPRSFYEDDVGPTDFTEENIAEPEMKAAVKQEPNNGKAVDSSPIVEKKK
ncbi:MlaA family lipoprotein [Noviherbaspirillum autotrophicum]|uniref:MlaA family lipoprotein n=1 Tax=Noviherbaspirillum autotrophicum TaxID=709839 RepID=UPI0009FD3ABE|nr:VacJ family lipoprotein [Noviherbaspirillum autotrophicum]